MRNLNIIYTMHYFRCIWTSPDIMLLQNADDFLPSYVPIYFSICKRWNRWPKF